MDGDTGDCQSCWDALYYRHERRPGDTHQSDPLWLALCCCPILACAMVWDACCDDDLAA
jgi:hypothetical protein